MIYESQPVLSYRVLHTHNLTVIVAVPRTRIRYFGSTIVAFSFVLKYTKAPCLFGVFNRPFVRTGHFRRDKSKKELRASKHSLPKSGLSANPRNTQTCCVTERAHRNYKYQAHISIAVPRQPLMWPARCLVWSGCSHTSLHEVTEVTAPLETPLGISVILCFLSVIREPQQRGFCNLNPNYGPYPRHGVMVARDDLELNRHKMYCSAASQMSAFLSLNKGWINENEWT